MTIDGGGTADLRPARTRPVDGLTGALTEDFSVKLNVLN